MSQQHPFEPISYLSEALRIRRAENAATAFGTSDSIPPADNQRLVYGRPGVVT
jgi:hypothetical protein